MARALAVLLAGLLAGCQPLAISMLGGGASTAVGHSLNGAAYRTFTAPLPEVKKAALDALERMGIAPGSFGRFEGGELITAHAGNRSIELELEPISARATRLRVVTKNGGFFNDTATATEIVVQTERFLEAGVTQFTGRARPVLSF